MNIEELYLKTRKKRDHIFKPLASLLHKAGFSPNMLSYLGVVLAIGFYYLSDKYFLLSAGLLILAKIADITDGPLARLGHKNSPKGATVDFICDQIVFLILMLTLIKLKIVNFLLGGSFIILVFLSKLLRSVYYKTNHNYENKYKDLVLPIVITAIPYFTLIFYYFSNIKNLDTLLGVLSIVLIVDTVRYIWKITMNEA